LQPGERACGVAGQDAEEEEVQDQHEEQGAYRPEQLTRYVARPAQALSSALLLRTSTNITAMTTAPMSASPT
jgi:hypothetical protein